MKNLIKMLLAWMKIPTMLSGHAPSPEKSNSTGILGWDDWRCVGLNCHACIKVQCLGTQDRVLKPLFPPREWKYYQQQHS